MARQLRVGLTVMQQMLEWKVAVQSTQQILCSDSVSGLVIYNREELLGGALEESFEDAYFGDSVVRPTSMTTNAARSSGRGKVDDCVSEEGDIGEEVGLLLCGKRGICWVERDVLISSKDIDAKICGSARHCEGLPVVKEEV